MAPPRPAMPAERVNTASLVKVKLRPRVAQAAGLSFMAISRWPKLLRLIHTTTKATRAKANAPKTKKTLDPDRLNPKKRVRLMVSEPAWNRLKLCPKMVKAGNGNI